MTIALVIVSIFTVVCWALLIRAARVILSLDEMLQEISEVLSRYSQDLSKLTAGDLLLDHPEVREFQHRNLLALEEINNVVENIKRGRPKPPEENLPKPDVSD